MRLVRSGFQFQHFVQVPCDGFPFAVLIGSQPYGFRLLGFFFQLGYDFLFYLPVSRNAV